jgi:hypothetical protein
VARVVSKKVARQRLGKNALIVSRQRLVKNPLIVARKRLARNVTAVKNTHATIEELLDASFSMWPVSYQGKLLSNGWVKMPLSFLGNGSVKIPLSLLGNGLV